MFNTFMITIDDLLIDYCLRFRNVLRCCYVCYETDSNFCADDITKS